MVEVTSGYTVAKNRESLCRGASLEHSKFYAITGFETYLPKVTSRKWITVWTVNICCIHTYNRTYNFSYIHISHHNKQTRIEIHSFCRPFKISASASRHQHWHLNLKIVFYTVWLSSKYFCQTSFSIKLWPRLEYCNYFRKCLAKKSSTKFCRAHLVEHMWENFSVGVLL